MREYQRIALINGDIYRLTDALILNYGIFNIIRFLNRYLSQIKRNYYLLDKLSFNKIKEQINQEYGQYNAYAMLVLIHMVIHEYGDILAEYSYIHDIILYSPDCVILVITRGENVN